VTWAMSLKLGERRWRGYRGQTSASADSALPQERKGGDIGFPLEPAYPGSYEAW